MMKTSKLKTFSGLLILSFFLVNQIRIHSQTESIKDVEGNVYKTVKIGEQIWMAENLRALTYNDGEKISNADYTYPMGKVDKAKMFGCHYSWEAVKSKKLCPAGWHVPSDKDWQVLEVSLGMKKRMAASSNRPLGHNEVGGKLKATGGLYWNGQHLKRNDRFAKGGRNIGATNESGFTALPAGYGEKSGTTRFGHSASFWTSTKVSGRYAWGRLLVLNTSTIYKPQQWIKEKYSNSVRCVKD